MLVDWLIRVVGRVGYFRFSIALTMKAINDEISVVITRRFGPEEPFNRMALGLLSKSNASLTLALI